MNMVKAINNDREFVAQVIRSLPNIDSDTKQNWIENPRGLSKVLADVLCPLSDVETITIDYNMSFEEMVKVGRYDYVHYGITADRFQNKGEGQQEYEVKLFHFGHSISSEDAKRHIEEDGWEVAETENLLAFGAKNPEEQGKHPIVALGTVRRLRGDRSVPYLGRGDSGRRLDLHWWGHDWHCNFRFLAVRKVTK
jgi:hypothetical protein